MNETDRELIELAAKAAGIEVVSWNDYSIRPNDPRMRFSVRNYPWGQSWNPLTDDGDALRLSIKLGLQIRHYPIFDTPRFAVLACEKRWSADAERDIGNEDIQHYNGDPYAATRRAIVRAAAAMGAQARATTPQESA